MSGYIGNIPTPQATQTRETFTATASQTTFNTAGYTPGFVDVWLNGVKLVNGDDFTATNGSDVVLTVGAASGDTVEVLSFSTFEVNSQTFTGDTSAVNLNVTGTFTSRGIDDNATSTAMTLDASGSLLVGTTNDDPVVNNVDGFVVKSGRADASNNGISARFNRSGSDGDIVQFRKDGSVVGSIGTLTGDMYLGTGDTGLYFLDSSDAIIPANPSSPSVSDAIVNLGQPSYRFKNLYLSSAVYVGGTTTANALDDYEEGTWTPTANAGLSGFTVQDANYTKVGNIVTVWFWVSSTTGPTSGSVIIGGLPYASSSGVYGFIGNCVVYGSSNTSGADTIYLGQGASTFTLTNATTTGSDPVAGVSGLSISSGSSIQGTLIYRR